MVRDCGFCLFRIFDIAKPLGIRKMESLRGGVGVMMDDILAGVYSFILLAGVRCDWLKKVARMISRRVAFHVFEGAAFGSNGNYCRLSRYDSSGGGCLKSTMYMPPSQGLYTEELSIA